MVRSLPWWYGERPFPPNCRGTNLARTYRWQALIDSGTYSNTIELADAIGKDPAYVARLIRLTLLAPEIVHAILAGTLQKSISLETLRKELPVRWSDQKQLFGVE